VTQLALDLGLPPAPSFANFVPGQNAEALAAVASLAATPAPAGAVASRFVYLWGPTGSGKSHLLSALAATSAAAGAGCRWLDPDSPPAAFTHDPEVSAWLCDGCDALPPASQQAAFHLFQAIQAHGRACWVATGHHPPARLAVMPELATRLGWGLVLQLEPLSDADKAEALARTLDERGVVASAEVVPWLMTHGPRDLGSLRATIDALDAYALERQRPVTLPLLRELLQRRLL
jgi:DnaA-homolog protein